MEFEGRLKTIAKDWATGEMLVTFTAAHIAPEAVEAVKDMELTVKAAKRRNKRSLDANAYSWVLMQKLAEACHTDKGTIYLRCLQRYSRKFTHIIVKEKAVQAAMEAFRTCIDLGEVSVNCQQGHQLQVYFGSSTFDTKEMSVFLDGIISECKELGIETATPAELERMKARWNV
jgi:hypothetical protein